MYIFYVSVYIFVHITTSSGGTTAQWLMLLPQSKKVVGLIPGQGVSGSNLHLLPVPAWVLTWCSGFLPQYKNMQNWGLG